MKTTYPQITTWEGEHVIVVVVVVVIVYTRSNNRSRSATLEWSEWRGALFVKIVFEMYPGVRRFGK